MYKQVRKINPTRRSVSGIYPFRGEVSIPFESTLERDFLILQEANPYVSRVVPQPVELSYQHLNGQTYRYTPDFLVYRDNSEESMPEHYWKPILVEVKPRAELLKNFVKLRSKFKSAMSFAREQGFLFHIHDERRIRTVKLENLQFLTRYKRFPYTQYEPAELNRLLERVSVLGHCNISDLINSLYKSDKSKARALAQVWHLLATHKLACDLTLSLNLNSEVWITEYE